MKPELEQFSVTLEHPAVGRFVILGSIFTTADGRRIRSPGLRFADPVPEGPFPDDMEAWIDREVTAALTGAPGVGLVVVCPLCRLGVVAGALHRCGGH